MLAHCSAALITSKGAPICMQAHDAGDDSWGVTVDHMTTNNSFAAKYPDPQQRSWMHAVVCSRAGDKERSLKRLHLPGG